MTSRVRSLSVREIDSASCEMKRMFVYTQFHGKGVGHTLTDAVINEARALGYRTMRLDTSIRQDEARACINAWASRQSSPTMSFQRI